MAGKADSNSSVSASACHIDGTNSVNPGQILLVYGTYIYEFLCKKEKKCKNKFESPYLNDCFDKQNAIL